MRRMVNESPCACLLKHQFWHRPVVHEAPAGIHTRSEIHQEVPQAPSESPFDVRGWDVVPAVPDPLGHALV